jgi:trk system potassium uptake protein TrkA
MKIIIVGGGKVGETLVANLCSEGHDITVIDSNDKVVDQVCDRYDVMGFSGNGASYTILEEADVENADLVIAVTGHDDLNLFVCLLARKAGHCQTIARVHNPEYNRAVNVIREELGLALVINQEFAAAQEAARVLRFPSAIEINTFAKGKVELLHFRVPQGSVLDGLDLYSMHEELNCNVLVCTLEREGDTLIPQGNTVLKAGDVISIVAPLEEQERFFSRIGLETHAVRNAMIIGGGDVALYLGRMLLNSGIQVKIIEKDLSRCEELAELLPKASIIHGDGSDKELLEEEGIRSTEGIVCLTGIDEENVVLSLFAKTCGVRKIITKVNRVAFEEVFESLNLDTMISPKNITAELIVQYVRAMQNSFGSNIETLHRIMDDQAEALEFKIRENFTRTDIPLSKLPLKSGVLVGAIYRDGRFILPRGGDVIRHGDTVLIITTIKGVNDISDVFR